MKILNIILIVFIIAECLVIQITTSASLGDKEKAQDEVEYDEETNNNDSEDMSEEEQEEDEECQKRPECSINRKKAEVVLDIGNSGNNVRGNIKFVQNSATSRVEVRGKITGLTVGKSGRNYHGFHIHATANTTSECDSTGGHFNPKTTLHGDRKNDESKRHFGDFGNIIANKNGLVKIRFQDKIISLFGNDSIVGKTLVVHQDEDDLGTKDDAGSKATGNSGARIACGIIKLIS